MLLVPICLVLVHSGLAKEENFSLGKYDTWTCHTHCYVTGDGVNEYSTKKQAFRIGVDARAEKQTNDTPMKMFKPIRYELITESNARHWCDSIGDKESSTCSGSRDPDQGMCDDEWNCENGCWGRWCEVADVEIHQVMMCWDHEILREDQLSDLHVNCVGTKGSHEVRLEMFWGANEGSTEEHDGYLHTEYSYMNQFCKSTCKPKEDRCPADMNICTNYLADKGGRGTFVQDGGKGKLFKSL